MISKHFIELSTETNLDKYDELVRRHEMSLLQEVGDMLIEADDKLANFSTTFDVNQNDVTGEQAKEYGMALGTHDTLRKVMKLMEPEVKKIKKKGKKNV